MIIGRILGWLFVGGAFVILGYDLLQFLGSQSWNVLLLGELWFKLDAGSLNLVQAVIQRYIFPALWDPVIVTVLLWPASLLFLLIGLLLLFFFRKRKRAEGHGFIR
jgi:hypothetical protein|tara:strand:+ start:72 stop:389 length:318 start_codon:yes stop_codon:yes gene_type:complete